MNAKNIITGPGGEYALQQSSGSVSVYRLGAPLPFSPGERQSEWRGSWTLPAAVVTDFIKSGTIK